MPMNFAAMRRRSQMGRRNSGGLRQAFTPPPAPSIPPPTVGNYGEPRMNTMPVNQGAMEKTTVAPPNSTPDTRMGSPGGANVSTPTQKSAFPQAPTEQPSYGIPTQVPEMDSSRRRAMMLPQ